MEPIIQNVEVKSVLTKSNLPVADYSVNPYVGCVHRQLATIMNKSTIPPIKNSNEQPIVLQNFSSHSPDNSKLGNSKQLSIMDSISPLTDNV